MTYTKESVRPIEEVEQRLREAAQRHKFGVLNVLDIKQTLKSKGFDFGRECRIFDVCNPQAANTALQHDMQAASVLPCRIAVYGRESGCTLATVKPTDLMRATGISGVESLALQIEKEIFTIIDEAA
jgi:uncharacterized protein (DUF302 family)